MCAWDGIDMAWHGECETRDRIFGLKERGEEDSSSVLNGRMEEPFRARLSRNLSWRGRGRGLKAEEATKNRKQKKKGRTQHHSKKMSRRNGVVWGVLVAVVKNV